MFAQLGLRFRMTVSYVVTTAVAVLIVEAVLLVLVAPLIRSAQDAANTARSGEAQAQVHNVVVEHAATLGMVAENLSANHRGMTDAQLLDAVAAQGFGHLMLLSPSKGVAKSVADAEVLTTPDGTVVRSSDPANYPAGSRLPAITTGTAGNGTVGWATRPVSVIAPPKDGSTWQQRPVGVLYVQLARNSGLVNRAPNSKPDATDMVVDTGGLLLPGLVILMLLVPLGLLFGLLNTRRLTRRIHRLADVTNAMAQGHRQSRIPVSGGDEVGRLEDGFNRMAEQLEAAVEVERHTAGVKARWAERTRIARELHDSVSQDLFSVALLAGGLRKALPEGTELQRQAGSMESTVNRTMLEMQALLLELRPIALEDAGLVPALRELCQSYETRLGIPVAAELAPLQIPPALEHTVLRVVQEALSNAARHGQAQTIRLNLAKTDGHVVVTIQDDGQGFDVTRVSERHGMGLKTMRERVSDLGGTVDVTSVPAQGTIVRIRIPRGER